MLAANQHEADGAYERRGQFSLVAAVLCFIVIISGQTTTIRTRESKQPSTKHGS